MASNTDGSNNANTQTVTTGASLFQWILAWGVILIVLGLVNRTDLGHRLIYYMLWLMLIFLLATQYRFFAFALSPFLSKAPREEPIKPLPPDPNNTAG